MSALSELADEVLALSNELRTHEGHLHIVKSKLEQLAGAVSQEIGATQSEKLSLLLNQLLLSSENCGTAANQCAQARKIGEDWAASHRQGGGFKPRENSVSSPTGGSQRRPNKTSNQKQDSTVLGPDGRKYKVRRETAGWKGDANSPGTWNQSLQKPAPNTCFIVDEKFRYFTDGLGRVIRAETVLDRVLTKEENRKRRHEKAQSRAGGGDRQDSDSGGHLFAARFGGPGEEINIVAQLRAQNNGRNPGE